MSQPWQPQPNQYGPPQPPPGYGYPGPYPPQQPMGPGYGGYRHPGFPPPPPRANGGKAFLFSLIIAGALMGGYALFLIISYEDLSRDSLQITYLGLAATLAVLIGLTTGNIAGRSTGSHIGGAIIATAATFFAVTNGYVAVILEAGGTELLEAMLEHDAGAPAEFWWERLSGGVALIGLALAGGICFLTGHTVGRKKPY
ncbi:hypothetical protein JGS22_021950 [Streptomyces sp. P38-E01]|uniref:Uncharacterized protein n=1 Tax=Streptomyces tardus TaxID=2780544 RepID=A0A949JHH5_9ACTN|nr:hypothetical protein [Streptomyces tardus]MBU7600221.1 hypothetical protein [Streptomyces tardus]